MQIANLDTETMLFAQQMHAHRRRGSKVHTRSSNGHLMIGKQHSTTQFEVRLDPSPSREVPLQSQRVKSRSVSGVVALEDHENRNRVQSVFESSVEKSRTMRPGQDPAITQANIPDIDIRCPSGNGVPAARPYLDFMTTIFGPR